MYKVGPWYFPDSGSTVCSDAAIQEVQFIEQQWLSAVDGRRVCVQAGGNCGIFPLKLAAFFDAVYTAEPDIENFTCLAINCPSPNVYAMRAAFGKEAGTVGLHKLDDNAGGHWIEGEGTIPVMTIDGLNLPACDLIALDTEGSELLALQGAAKTIDKHSPTLIVEDKNHLTRFGQDRDDLYGFMRDMGYKSVGWAWRDQIWSR